MIYVGCIDMYGGGIPYGISIVYRLCVPNVLRYTPRTLAPSQFYVRTCQTHGVLRNTLRFYTVFYAALRRPCALQMAV